MKCVVPLAGPDFYHPSYGIKAFINVEGRPLIQRALESRAWIQSGELSAQDLIFVLRASEHTTQAQERLAALFPGSLATLVPCMTRGALLSALAGAALVADYQSPLVVDLVDILYEADFSPEKMFTQDARLAGIVPFFSSQDPAFSYLDLDGMRVLRTAEKKVISSNASAGTYFFRDLACFLEAAQASVAHFEQESYQGNLFVCPCFNGLIQKGWVVRGAPVQNADPISKRFHQPLNMLEPHCGPR